MHPRVVRACVTPWNEVPNCVAADGSEEFSVVFDDASADPPTLPEERLKLLWGNGSISIASESGERWTANWNRSVVLKDCCR